MLSWSFFGDIIWGAPIAVDRYHFGSGYGAEVKMS